MALVRVAAVAFIVTALLIPILVRFAVRLGLMDVPNARKIHHKPVPLVGGLAVYWGVVAALIAGGMMERQVLLVLLASFAVVLLGILDDRLDLRSIHRLAFQVVIAALLCFAGVRFHVFGIEALDWAATILWMVGTINAVNCLDCADGMAGSSAFATFAVFAASALLNGRLFVCQTAIAGAAAVGGFLLYNRPKATVFLGDTGSTFLGLMLASMAILASPKAPMGETQFPWLTLALFVPAYDITLVHWRRYRAGITNVRDLLASTGKDHLPHRLLARDLTGWGAMGILALLSGLSSLAAWFYNMHHWESGTVFLLSMLSLLWRIETISEPLKEAGALVPETGV
jgi:UDP-GlcNAc:undecaprenyl-phosphate/decaprenyl-phosphate GlcNAc-1-phosphate transferase